MLVIFLAWRPFGHPGFAEQVHAFIAFLSDSERVRGPQLSLSHDRRSYINGVFPHCSGTNLDSCGPFTLPAVGQEGNERVNLFRNPGLPKRTPR